MQRIKLIVARNIGTTDLRRHRHLNVRDLRQRRGCAKGFLKGRVLTREQVRPDRDLDVEWRC
jgi:hypothetical protein